MSATGAAPAAAHIRWLSRRYRYDFYTFTSCLVYRAGCARALPNAGSRLTAALSLNIAAHVLMRCSTFQARLAVLRRSVEPAAHYPNIKLFHRFMLRPPLVLLFVNCDFSSS